MSNGNFGDAFRKAIAELHSDAAALGVPMAEICRSAGVSRATPHRYQSEDLPATVRTVVKMQDEIEKLRAAAE